MSMSYVVPGMSSAPSKEVIDLLQGRLSAYNDLHLTLKHVHWNVTGANFISIHEMLDPQVELVRGYADAVAERIATMGGSPLGTPTAIVEQRTWEDYPLNRDTTLAHLQALNSVYTGLITSNRKAIDQTADTDPVTQDLLISQTAELEKFQWFVRAHIENLGGSARS